MNQKPNEPTTPLTAEEKLLIQHYVATYVGRWAKIFGIPTVLAAVAAFAYVLFVLPQRLSEDAVARAGAAATTQINDQMTEWRSDTDIIQLLADVANARAELQQESENRRNELAVLEDEATRLKEQLRTVDTGLLELEELYAELTTRDDIGELGAVRALLDEVARHGDAPSIVAGVRANEAGIRQLKDFDQRLEAGEIQLVQLRCMELVVHDRAGRTVATLGQLDGGGSLRLRSGKGEETVTLAGGAARGTMVVSGIDGKRVATLGAFSSDRGYLRLYSDDKKLISLGSSTNDNPHIWFYDVDGERLLDLGIVSGTGHIKAYNAAGSKVVSIGASTTGNGGCWFYDVDGNESGSFP